MKLKTFCVALSAVVCLLSSAGAAVAESALQKTTTFALGGVGYAGVMSEGERMLREILKESDAPKRLEGMLPNASAAGQLYALLGLRLRARAAYERALEKYRAKDVQVETMRGCIMQRESFRKLIEQIDRGDYDLFLEREWPEPKR